MALTPFHDLPKQLFLTRISPICAALFIFLFFCVGVVANSLEFQQLSGPSAVTPFWISAFKHYGHVVSHLFQIPGVCLPGRAVNDFQVNQCNGYWEQLAKSGGLALAPLAAIGAFILMSLDNLKALYKKAQKRAEIGKAAFGGTVTNPAEAPGDLFSWFYCLRPVMVELKNKTQIKVYVPLDSPIPMPGQTMAVFEPVSSFGEKRHFAVLYTPHVAVVRGT